MTMFFNVFFINLLDKNNGTLYLQKIKKGNFCFPHFGLPIYTCLYKKN